jgi:hypothetical protein
LGNITVPEKAIKELHTVNFGARSFSGQPVRRVFGFASNLGFPEATGVAFDDAVEGVKQRVKRAAIPAFSVHQSSLAIYMLRASSPSH